MATATRQTKGLMSPRQRTLEPDPTTPNGQWALYLRKLLDGKRAEDVAAGIGRNKSSVFKWLRGEIIPPLAVWADLARFLQLPGWWSLVPPAEFVDSLPKRRRRKG